MESRFYTPKIEELSVGQECEISWNFGELRENSFGEKYDDTYFYKETITPQFIDLFNSEKYFSIRFKFLDKEDIQSLGFIQTIEDQYYKDDFELLIDDDLFIQIIKDDGFVFRGTIKNKSEFKKLLIQTGIINE